jgi:hypothetical protein
MRKAGGLLALIAGLYGRSGNNYLDRVGRSWIFRKRRSQGSFTWMGGLRSFPPDKRPWRGQHPHLVSMVGVVTTLMRLQVLP